MRRLLGREGWPPRNDMVKRFDANDGMFYAGLVLLFAGLAVSVSVGTALGVVGAVLSSVALVNSYVRLIVTSKQERTPSTPVKPNGK
jgi:hypothetical protein